MKKIPADGRGPAGARLKPPADIRAAAAEIIARLSFPKGNFTEMSVSFPYLALFYVLMLISPIFFFFYDQRIWVCQVVRETAGSSA